MVVEVLGDLGRASGGSGWPKKWPKNAGKFGRNSRSRQGKAAARVGCEEGFGSIFGCLLG